MGLLALFEEIVDRLADQGAAVWSTI